MKQLFPLLALLSSLLLAQSASRSGRQTLGTPLAQPNGGTGTGSITCATGQALTSNGTTYSCANVSQTVGVLPLVNGGSGTGALTCSAGQVLTSDGSVYSCVAASSYSAHAYFSSTLVNNTIVHASGVQVTIATLTLPVGFFFVSALASVEVTGRSGSIDLNQCRLTDPSTNGATAFWSHEYVIVNAGQTINASATFESLGTDTLTFSCKNTDAVLDLNVTGVSLSAIKIDALN